MARIKFPENFKDEQLEKELKKFNLFEVFRNDLSVLEILMLNDIINRYLELSSIETDDGEYKIYNYSNLNAKYRSFYVADTVLSTSKNKLVSKGFIKCKSGHFNCKNLGYCKLAIKINNKKIDEILYN